MSYGDGLATYKIPLEQLRPDSDIRGAKTEIKYEGGPVTLTIEKYMDGKNVRDSYEKAYWDGQAGKIILMHKMKNIKSRGVFEAEGYNADGPVPHEGGDWEQDFLSYIKSKASELEKLDEIGTEDINNLCMGFRDKYDKYEDVADDDLFNFAANKLHWKPVEEAQKGEPKPVNGWVSVEELPDEVFKKIKDNNGFVRPHTSYVLVYKDSTGKKWLVVTDDGGYYKVDAEYMVWYIAPEIKNEDGIQSQAIWTDRALRKTLKSFMETGKRTNDPRLPNLKRTSKNFLLS